MLLRDLWALLKCVSDAPCDRAQVNATLTAERGFAKRLGEEAGRTKSQLHSAMQASASLADQNSMLDEELTKEKVPSNQVQ